MQVEGVRHAIGDAGRTAGNSPAFALHTELHGPETVDLGPFMREDILLNLPAHPRCDREGGRVCKLAKSEAASPETKRKPDWSALDKLKLKK